MAKSKYEELGVSTQKPSVEAAFGKSTDTDFPYAFCKLIIDPDNPNLVIAQKNDGSGSKPVVRIIYFMETDNIEIMQGDPFDVYAMCAGDAAASGQVMRHIFTDTININKFNVPKAEILKQMDIGFVKVMELHRKYGIWVKFLGGETADLPIQTGSMITDGSLHARGKISQVISGEVRHGDVIFGLASDGKAVWENELNSGIMSNGLTLTGHVLLHSDYNQLYPYLVHPKKPFQGRFYVKDGHNWLGDLTIGRAMLSPTRQWAIVIKMLIDELVSAEAFHLLHGITMNTGGAATKLLRLGQNIHYIKNMPRPPGIFQLIKYQGNIAWREMFEDYNCGVGIDIIGSPEGGMLERCIYSVASKAGIIPYPLGICKKSIKKKNTLLLKTFYGDYFYKGR